MDTHREDRAGAPGWPLSPPTSVSRDGRRLRLEFGGDQALSIPLVWLRDNCVCEECRIVRIDERRYFLGRAETMPRAVSAAVRGGDLVLRWDDGHESTYRGGDLARLRRIGRRQLPTVTLWRGDFRPERFDAETVYANADERLRMLRSYLVHGVVLLTGTDTAPGACGEIIQRLGAPIRATPFDVIHDVFFRADGYNIAHSAEALLPHTDFPSYQWPPSGQVLHMLVNEASGGESIVVDGWQVVEALRRRSPHAFDILSSVRISWREHSDEHETWSRAPVIRTDRQGCVLGIRFSNQLMQPLDPTLPEVEDFYDAYHELARMIVDPANQVRFRMEGGDLMLTHGHRVLHGRTAFDPGAGTRHLQDTYFEFDDLAAQAARLGGEIPA